MARRPIAVTLTSFAGQQSTGVYEATDGIPVFISDEPYLSANLSLQPPLPIFVVSGGSFSDAMGSDQSSLAVSGLNDILPQNLTWDANTPWDSSTYWS